VPTAALAGFQVVRGSACLLRDPFWIATPVGYLEAVPRLQMAPLGSSVPFRSLAIKLAVCAVHSALSSLQGHPEVCQRADASFFGYFVN